MADRMNYIAAAPKAMLSELRNEKRQLAASMREAHKICGQHSDWATTSLLENCIDEAEGQVWFLVEIGRSENQDGES